MLILSYLILLFSFPDIFPSVSVTDFSKVYHATIHSLYYPKTITELSSFVKKAEKPIAIAGGKYSMGGQIWFKDGIMIDMSYLNAITSFDPEAKTITVQAGARWSDIQTFLLKHNLTIMVMQSYNNFSLGGSISVNVHGRDPHGQIIHTIKSIHVMLADGTIVTADRHQNRELFRAVIGGYGSCGICIDATFYLEDNHKIQLKKTTIPLGSFTDFYKKNVASNKDISLFNANLYAPHFNEVVNFVWSKTDKALTIEQLMQKNSPAKPIALKKMMTHAAEYMVSEYSLAQKLRLFFENNSYLQSNTVVWRSYEMSYTVDSLAPSTEKTAKILQEYFIPIEKFNTFTSYLKEIFTHNQVKVLNVSIRHAPQETESFLSYAPKESFAFVCYISIENSTKGHKKTALWTQKLIDAALSLNGSYYLPYHLFARPDQYLKAYPHYGQFLSVKKTYDPQGKFKNSLTDLLQKSYESMSS